MVALKCWDKSNLETSPTVWNGCWGEFNYLQLLTYNAFLEIKRNDSFAKTEKFEFQSFCSALIKYFRKLRQEAEALKSYRNSLRSAAQCKYHRPQQAWHPILELL